jgi:ubiquinol-cytochrome c reductase cytochrome c subunit
MTRRATFVGRWAILGILAFLGAGSPCAAQERDDEEAALRAALGERSFRENCLICHGPEMTTSQRLSTHQWKAEMTKMLGWGAPVPAEEVGLLTDWLIAEFPQAKPAEPPRVEPAAALGGASRPGVVRVPDGDAELGQRLYDQHCASCHGKGAQGGDLGPNLVERPVLVEEDQWREVVQVGRRRMPGYALVLTPRQSAEIRAWLLGQTYTEPR